MATLTIQKTWNVNSVPTAPDSAPTLGIVRNDTGATVVTTGTAMDQVATGVYQYSSDAVDGGTTYTATITVVYAGQTYTFTVVAAPEVTASGIDWPDEFDTILNQLMALAVQITLSPNPTYAVHGYSYKKGEYLEILGRQIEQFTKLNAQAHPFEIVTRG
jgi:hypothetical protein